MAYVMALDAGTTSCRAMVFDREGRVRGVAQRELEQHFPQPGWVEHDAEEIWTAQAGVMVEAAARARAAAGDIAAVGITNQRETTVVWDRKTGLPVCRAIVWQDRRTASACERMRREGLEEMVREKTGLVIDSYFSATKLAWILDHVEGARARAERGELAFGTVESWLVWKLSGGACHVTDATNASRTMLYNIHTGDWDEELLRVMRVPRVMLPAVRGCSEVYASVRSNLLASAEVPIAGMAGDQQSALFGQLCLSPGRTKTTYGTGCFTLMNMGEEAASSRHRLLTTVASRLGGRTAYALEGSVFMGGAIVQWLRDGLGLIRESKEIGALAASVPDTGGVVLVPAFTGLGAPHWNAGARGMLIGMTRGTGRGQIARAALEAIAHQVADVVEAMEADSGLRLEEMRVDGGASRDDELLQIQADLLGARLVRPKQVETTALGAAYLAGLAVGVWRDAAELEAADHVDRVFEPGAGSSDRAAMRDRWRRALERSKDWIGDGRGGA